MKGRSWELAWTKDLSLPSFSESTKKPNRTMANRVISWRNDRHRKTLMPQHTIEEVKDRRIRFINLAPPSYYEPHCWDEEIKTQYVTG